MSVSSCYLTRLDGPPQALGPALDFTLTSHCEVINIYREREEVIF
jgi:hypothetical protein